MWLSIDSVLGVKLLIEATVLSGSATSQLTHVAIGRRHYFLTMKGSPCAAYDVVLPENKNQQQRGRKSERERRERETTVVERACLESRSERLVTSLPSGSKRSKFLPHAKYPHILPCPPVPHQILSHYHVRKTCSIILFKSSPDEGASATWSFLCAAP